MAAVIRKGDSGRRTVRLQGLAARLDDYVKKRGTPEERRGGGRGVSEVVRNALLLYLNQENPPEFAQTDLETDLLRAVREIGEDDKPAMKALVRLAQSVVFSGKSRDVVVALSAVVPQASEEPGPAEQQRPRGRGGA